MDWTLLYTLATDLAAALAFSGLLVTLAMVSRRAAIRGAVPYAAGYLGFSSGSAVIAVMLEAPDPLLQFNWSARLALLVAAAGLAAMVDGLSRLLELQSGPRLARKVWWVAVATLVLAWVPWPIDVLPKTWFDLVNIVGVLCLIAVLLRPYPQPYRLAAWTGGACMLVLLPLYVLCFLLDWPGPKVTLIPSYSEWVWLDLALWNTLGLCVMMVASFRALLTFSRDAGTDALTGCLNRRGLENEVASLSNRQDVEFPVAVMSFDIDHFKAINDRYGHSAGDAYLKAFAGALKSCMRNSDLLARTGGEEFVGFLAGADGEAAHRVATKVLQAVRELTVAHEGQQINATVSIGIAVGVGLASAEALKELSDKALYDAKRSGRDRVHVYPG
jgi:diguanylate cyclase (GGDEF)-like protein